MTDELKPKSKVPGKKVPAPLKVEPERKHFRALLLSNPNYFGTVGKGPFQLVKKIVGNTKYEELTCVGYNPEMELLEAVVLVKQNGGYLGGVCSDGSPEYVRFYLSWDGGTSWVDQGLTSFQAYDIPGVKPLEYAVTLKVAPRRKICKIENLIRVRAILSWNVAPAPNSPDAPPVWGNVLEATIQVDKLRTLLIDEFLHGAKAKLDPAFKDLLDPAQQVAFKSEALTAAEKHALYKGARVPSHRYLYPEVHEMMAKPAWLSTTLAAGVAPGPFAELDISMADLIAKLLDTDGNTNFEELSCVGLDPDLSRLVAVVNVKLSSGYSGSLCTKGSLEYVAFWVDWGDGAGWNFVGTTSVRVHDLSLIPAGGVQYAAFLPIDLISHRQRCEMGAKTARVRAILSWATSPPPGDPDHVPVWGNREETVIHIKPGPAVPANMHPPFIETVGNMAVSSIDNLTGLADGAAVGAGFEAADSPFGAEVVVTGHIANAPDIVGGGATKLKYRVLISDDNWATTQYLNNKFTIWLSQFVLGVWIGPTPLAQIADAANWYEYYEDLQTTNPANAQQFVAENVLARWQTGGRDGLWKLRIEVCEDPSNPLATHWFSNPVTICLDNTAPQASITITTGLGACADFIVGDPISGTYTASDEHLYKVSFSVEPHSGEVFTAPAPLPQYPALVSPTATGNWTLDTGHMPRCGYAVLVHVWDRTIVNSGYIGWYGYAAVGLCLRDK